nr:MAG: hypothetical protein KVP17_005145 [Porospora cf. gigantea B]
MQRWNDDPTTLVDDMDTERDTAQMDLPWTCYSQVRDFASRYCRFPPVPDHEIIASQLERRNIFLKEVQVKDFRPTSERDLENWVDECARQVKKFKISPILFHDIWVNAAPDRLAAKMHRVDPNQPYEDMVDQVALILYPTSRYARRLEDSLLFPKRHETVDDVEYGLGAIVARYLRLCHRRRRNVCLANGRFREVMMKSLPECVESELRRLKPSPKNLDDILRLAYQYE